MALTLAIPLSGMEFDQFHGILNRYDLLAPDQAISPSTLSDSSGIGSLTPYTDVTTPSLSPISDNEMPTDDNSYFNGTDQQKVHPWTSRILSDIANIREMEAFYRRLITPSVSLQTCQPIARSNQRLLTTVTTQEFRAKDDMKIMYKNRNILNLGANLRRPSWQINVRESQQNYPLDCVNHEMDSCQPPDDENENYCSLCKFCDKT